MVVRVQGVVKFFDVSKGFGFIRRKGDTDVFVHLSQLKKCGIDELNKGAKVEFDLIISPDSKGRPTAANIKQLTA